MLDTSDDERDATADGESDASGRPSVDTDAGEPPGPFGLERRTLIRLLVGVGIGVPILVEAATLLGLVGDLFGPGGDETGTPTRTAEPGVGVGDELLPDTPAIDTVVASYIAADGWRYTLTVAVENTTGRTYELRLRDVTTADGRTVAGGGESDPIPPGESGSVTGRWDLPEGASPESVDVVAIARNGTVTKVERSVPLGSTPVQGG